MSGPEEEFAIKTVKMVRRRYVPGFDRLEDRDLLTNLGSFLGPIVVSGTKQAYVLAGMNFTVQVGTPPSYPGATIASLQYILQKGVGLNPGDVQYTTSLGTETDGTVTVKKTFATPPPTDRNPFTAYKDPGNYTLHILGQFNVPGGGKVSASDTLYVQVEAPTVSGVFVDQQPTQFSWVNSAGVPQSGSGGGSNGIGFTGWQTSQVNGQTVNTPGSLFHATVDNTTDYYINVGFVQTIQFNRSATYANTPPVALNSNGDNWWDGTNAQANALWYNDRQTRGWWTLAPGQQLELKDNSYPFVFIDDTPWQSYPPESQGGNLVRSVSINDQFQTSVAIIGGSLSPMGQQPVTGIPVALSTASWTVAGSATTTANTLAGVEDLGNWLPTGLSPATQTPSPGDGVIKFLNWKDNGPARLAAYIANGVAGSMGGSGQMAPASPPLGAESRALAGGPPSGVDVLVTAVVIPQGADDTSSVAFAVRKSGQNRYFYT